MTRKLRLFFIMASFLLVVSMIVGCGTPAATTGTSGTTKTETTTTKETEPAATTTGTQPAETTAATVDISEKVELIMYLFGDPAQDLDLVLGEVNKKLTADLNCTLKINYIPWTDYQTKYSLLLASGEPIDLIYTAVWTPFTEHAQKGAFLPLNDLLPVYAPESYSKYSDLDWIEAGYDGKIYALPSYVVMMLPEGILYRDDLRKKYNLEPISSIETLEAYLAAVKANEPDIIPYNASTTLEEMALLGLFNLKYGYTMAPDPLNKILAYPDTVEQEKMRELQILTEMPEFAEFLGMTRDWYEKGYWSKSVLSNKIHSMDAMVQGKSAVTFCHIDRCKGTSDLILASNPEWEPKAWFPDETKKIIRKAATMQDAMALPRTCRYPERALMVLEKLRNDQTYYDLVSYGILGKHYELTADGKYTTPAGVDAAKNTYPVEGMNSWGWRNYKLRRISGAPNQWMDYYDTLARIEQYAVKDKFNTFQLDQNPISAELAAVSQLDQQYLYPLMFGVLDPVAGLEEYHNQLKAAGIDTIFEECKKQITEFADRMGF